MAEFKIFTDSCSDLSTEDRRKSGVEYFRMNIVLDGEEKPADLDWKEYSYDEFYGWMYAGRKIKTTQVPVTEFVAKMRPFAEKGIDILYFSCSSKLSGSINVFEMAKEQILEEFPDRKIIGIDSQTATGCEGMLAVMASKLQKEGKTIEEVADWLVKNRNKINQWATVDDLKYLKNAGRIKGAKAFFGNLVGVKPIIISYKLGNNLALKNVRGTKAALEEIFQGVKATINKDECNVVWVGHGKAEASAAKLKERFKLELDVEVHDFLIGPIIGTSCGPGVVCACCFGKEVERFEGDGVKE
ncbi:MAG: DegV family protein [Bacilli bacterium]|nr:DegV family protein [Bacilli bacterium]